MAVNAENFTSCLHPSVPQGTLSGQQVRASGKECDFQISKSQKFQGLKRAG